MELLFAMATPSPRVVMPERRAVTPCTERVSDFIGPGPMGLVTSEWVPGSRAVFERNADHVPRSESGDWFAGGKHIDCDRIEWVLLPDPGAGRADRGAARRDGSGAARYHLRPGGDGLRRSGIPGSGLRDLRPARPYLRGRTALASGAGILPHRQRHRRRHRRLAAPHAPSGAPRQGHRHGVPGAHDQPASGPDGRTAERRGSAPASRDEPARGRSAGHGVADAGGHARAGAPRKGLSVRSVGACASAS